MAVDLDVEEPGCHDPIRAAGQDLHLGPPRRPLPRGEDPGPGDPEPIRAGDVVRLDEGADGGDASHPTVQVRQARLGPADLADQVGFVDRAVPDPPLDAVDQRPIAVGGRTEHVEGGPVEDRLARTRVPQHRRHHVELGSVRLAERAPDHVRRRDYEADGQSGQREGAAGTARSCWRGLENHREGEARVESQDGEDGQPRVTGHTGRRGQEQHEGDHAGGDEQGAVHRMDQQAPALSLEGDDHARQGEREDAERGVGDGSLPHEVGEAQVGQELARRAAEPGDAARQGEPRDDRTRDDGGAGHEAGQRASQRPRARLPFLVQPRHRHHEEDAGATVGGLQVQGHRRAEH